MEELTNRKAGWKQVRLSSLEALQVWLVALHPVQTRVLGYTGLWTALTGQLHWHMTRLHCDFIVQCATTQRGSPAKLSAAPKLARQSSG